MRPYEIASVSLVVSTEKVGERYVASVPSLGLFAYANVPDSAVERLGKAAVLLFDSLEESRPTDAIYAKLLSAEGVRVTTEMTSAPRAIQRVTLTPQASDHLASHLDACILPCRRA